MSIDQLEMNRHARAANDPQPCPPDPELQDAIVEVLHDLRSPTKQYVKARRIAAKLDVDATSVQVGKQLRRLSDSEDPPIEEWCRGNGSRTWRILLEVGDT